MASGIGPSPFSGGGVDIRNESEVAMLRKRHGQRMNREAMHSRGEEKRGRVQFGFYDRKHKGLYDKYGLATDSGYYKTPGRPPMKRLVDSNGTPYQTPDVIDWDDWVDMFHIQGVGQMSDLYKSKPVRGNYQTLADYCDWSFNRKESNFYTVYPPEGHIKRIDYHNGTKIMRVNFEKYNRWACYFFVPVQIFATLEALADGNHTRIGYGNVPRHLVGIYFWNLVRVRGTVHGNRYECCYTVDPGGGFRKVDGADASTVADLYDKDGDRSSGFARQIESEAGGDAAKPMYDLSEEQHETARNIRDENKKGGNK